MKYRKFGSLEWESSILGFGIAKLPFNAETASIELIRNAIDHGINYLDAGYPYDLGQQERKARLVGEALQDGYQQRIKIAVTLPSHLIHTTTDLDLHLDRQRSWLQAETIDFCLFGRLNRENWPVLQRLDALNWAEAAIEDRRIGVIGFSFRDHFQILKHVLASYGQWALCQFQFSYMDVDQDPGVAGIKYAATNGLAVVVTEPLRGGRLTRPPDAVARVWGNARGRGSLAEWGLRFVWNYPEVASAIGDIGSIYDLAENAAIADSMEPDSLTVQEELIIGKVRDAYREFKRIPCSSCRPCMPCPAGIDVPRIFELYNEAFIYEDVETARIMYLNELHHAEWCNQCGACEARCTKRLDIVGWLEEAHRLLAGSE